MQYIKVQSPESVTVERNGEGINLTFNGEVSVHLAGLGETEALLTAIGRELMQSQEEEDYGS